MAEETVVKMRVDSEEFMAELAVVEAALDRIREKAEKAAEAIKKVSDA